MWHVWNIQAKLLPIVNNFLTINLVVFSYNFNIEEVIHSALNFIQTSLVAFFSDLTLFEPPICIFRWVRILMNLKGMDLLIVMNF